MLARIVYVLVGVSALWQLGALRTVLRGGEASIRA
jgi:uncharacterized membrane protein YuzA (DUF378 family)